MHALIQDRREHVLAAFLARIFAASPAQDEREGVPPFSIQRRSASARKCCGCGQCGRRNKSCHSERSEEPGRTFAA
jgi:hypothetical protein